MEFLFHLFADLGWSDVFLPIKRMDHVQLFLRDQFIHNLNAVPLWQPARNQKFKSAADIQTHKKKGFECKILSNFYITKSVLYQYNDIK